LNLLRAGGCPVKDEGVAHLPPLLHEHIKMLGQYPFSVPEAVAKGELRPLRDPFDGNQDKRQAASSVPQHPKTHSWPGPDRWSAARCQGHAAADYNFLLFNADGDLASLQRPSTQRFRGDLLGQNSYRTSRSLRLFDADHDLRPAHQLPQPSR
jgi:hypothetical protein